MTSSATPAAVATPIATQPTVCAKTKGCKNEGFVCAASGCTKIICRKCYEVAVIKKNKISLDNALPDELVACTLKCHKKACNVTVNDQEAVDELDSQHWHRRVSWDNDTPTGSYEGSSEALLYDWLKQPGEFAYWKGNSQGISKVKIQHQVAKNINQEGFRLFGGPMRTRTAVQVGSKIAYIVNKFQKTYNWSHQTGQGIKDERNLSDQQFKDLVTGQFPHYWDLFDVMAERSSTRPVFSSDDLDITDDDDDDDALVEEVEAELVEVGATNPALENAHNEEEVELPSDDEGTPPDRGPTQLFAETADSSDDSEGEEAVNAGVTVASPVQHVYILDHQQSSAAMTLSSGKTASSRKRNNIANGAAAVAARNKRTATTGGSLVSSASFSNSIAQQQNSRAQKQQSVASVATSRKRNGDAGDTHALLSVIANKMDNYVFIWGKICGSVTKQLTVCPHPTVMGTTWPATDVMSNSSFGITKEQVGDGIPIFPTTVVGSIYSHWFLHQSKRGSVNQQNCIWKVEIFFEISTKLPSFFSIWPSVVCLSQA
jgi:hypothetical protein